ncbi:hypothetical protein AWA2045_17460 [Lactiplantibacillus plantarum]|nr:hypothetical protein AWA2045_17460 [Lactiplantibacillus plantarum]
MTNHDGLFISIALFPWQKAGSIEAKEKQDGINYRDLAQKGIFVQLVAILKG